MKSLGNFAFTLMSALLLVTGCQTSAGPKAELSPTSYESDQDVYVVFRGQVFENAATLLPAALIGELAFELQEGAHENITHVSGAEVDHYYIWLCLEDACIPVDPFTYSS